MIIKKILKSTWQGICLMQGLYIVLALLLDVVIWLLSGQSYDYAQSAVWVAGTGLGFGVVMLGYSLLKISRFLGKIAKEADVEVVDLWSTIRNPYDIISFKQLREMDSWEVRTKVLLNITLFGK